MDFDILPHTILLTVAGSRAYGIHTSTSDVDIKGVAIPPRKYILGFRGRFEQCDDKNLIAPFVQFLNNEQKEAVAREKLEGTVYDLRKFMRLATECNPNILDVLFCRDEEVAYITPLGHILRDNRELFLSAKAKHSFSGYAIAQLKRIKGHKAWLMNPPDHAPTREEFGLGEEVIPKKQYDILWDAIKKKMDTWSWDFGDMPESEIIRVENDIATHLAEIGACSSDMWVYAARALGSSEEIIGHVKNEKKYLDAKSNWEKYNDWKNGRNASRAALEAKYGYDTKHGAHLVRLLSTGLEIMCDGDVNVWRGNIDAAKLLGIRNGEWTYDYLVGWAEEKDAELTEIYKSKKYAVPHMPDFNALDNLCDRLLTETLK